MSEAIDQLTWKDLEVQLVSKHFCSFLQILRGNHFFKQTKQFIEVCGLNPPSLEAQVDAVDDQHFPFLGRKDLDFEDILTKAFWEMYDIYIYIYIYIYIWLTWIWLSFWVWCVFLVFSYFCGRKKHIYIYISILYMLNRCWNNLRASTIWETYLWNEREQPSTPHSAWVLSSFPRICCDLPVSVLEDHPI